MRYVTPELLARSLKALSDYSSTKDEKIKALFGIFVLKRQGVEHAPPRNVSIDDFNSVCYSLLQVVRQGDPTASYGEKLYNPFSDAPLTRPSWPRGTLWTRLKTNRYWRGIIAEGVGGWKFGPEFPDAVFSRFLREEPIPAFALAAFLFRRTSDLEDPPAFDTHGDMIDAFKTYFHLRPEEGQLFDFAVPGWASPLGDAEMSRSEVVRVVAAAPGTGRLATLLAAEATGTSGERSDEIVACALKMGQVLLFGPPGTGKSFWAEKAALRLVGRADLAQAVQDGLISLMIWHPSTAYEDFIGGVTVVNGTITPKPGIFRTFCDHAQQQLNQPHVFVIDEINRGNTVAILGELLYALELDKRGNPVTLSDQSTFVVPPNVYVIGTANTADRSIAALDVALGRRFARVEIPPEPEMLGDSRVLGIELQQVLQRLNTRIAEHVDREHRIGHSYFLDADDRPIASFEDLVFALKYRIIPLLQDYTLDDFEVLGEILGGHFVDLDNQNIKVEAFGSEDSLKSALTALLGV
jgi:hypothetical protein